MSTIDTGIAINPGPMGRVMRLARSQRVAWARKENSNGQYNAQGNNRGRVLGLAWGLAAAGYPIWGTPLITIGGVFGDDGAAPISTGWNVDAGYFFRSSPSTGVGGLLEASRVRGIYSSADAAFGLSQAYSFGRGESSASPWSTPHAALVMLTPPSAVTQGNGIRSDQTGAPELANLPDWREAFRGEIYLASVTPSGGTARPAISVSASLAAQAATFTATAGTPTWRNWTRVVTDTLAAGTRSGTIRFGVVTNGGSNTTGEVGVGYQQLVLPGRTSGFCVSMLWGQGGMSVLDMAFALVPGAVNTRALSDETIYHFMQAACQPIADLGQRPVLVVSVADSLNSRNEGVSSIPLAKTPASGADAYADNLTYIFSRMLAVWARLELIGPGSTIVRTRPEDLVFVSGEEHGISEPNDGTMVSYVNAAGLILAARFPRNFTAIRGWVAAPDSAIYAAGSNTGYAPNTTRTLNSITTGATPTLTTTANHTLIPGQLITLSGTNSTPAINGVHRVVATPTATTFTITPSAPVTVAGSAGTVDVRDLSHLSRDGYQTHGTLLARAFADLPPLPDDRFYLRGRR